MTLVLKKEGNEYKHGLFSGIRSELTHTSNDGLSDFTSVPCFCVPLSYRPSAVGSEQLLP